MAKKEKKIHSHSSSMFINKGREQMWFWYKAKPMLICGGRVYRWALIYNGSTFWLCCERDRRSVKAIFWILDFDLYMRQCRWTVCEHRGCQDKGCVDSFLLSEPLVTGRTVLLQGISIKHREGRKKEICPFTIKAAHTAEPTLELGTFWDGLRHFHKIWSVSDPALVENWMW